MSAFLFAMVAVALCSLGSRDQLIVAQLSARNGQGLPLLAVAWTTSLATALAMAWAGKTIAILLPWAAKTMLIAIALIVASFELAWPVRQRKTKEPTRSLAAAAIVLAARQIGDAPRFLIFAFAAAFATPWLAGLGGAVGSAVAVTLGWALGDDLDRIFPLRAIRAVLAILVLIMAVIVGLNARGLIG